MTSPFGRKKTSGKEGDRLSSPMWIARVTRSEFRAMQMAEALRRITQPSANSVNSDSGS